LNRRFRSVSRTFTLVAAAALPVVALAGCAGGSSSGGASAAHVTITFANADPSTTWAKAVAGFEKANPNITVKQENIPYAQYSATINQRMGEGGGGIDALVVDVGGELADFAVRGYLADLSSLKSDAEAAALSPDMVTAREFQGKLYAIEPWTTAEFLYYNKDLLKKAGVTAPPGDPSQPWTWEQLTTAAMKVEKAHAAQYPLVFDQWDTYYQLQPLGVSAGGGDGITPDGKVTFSDAGWQKALTWYHNLFTSGLSPRGITNDKNGALFETGKAAFLVSGPWGLATAVQGKLNFGVAPEPYFAGGQPATSTDSWGVGVSAKSAPAQQAAAKAFVRYLTIDAAGNTQSAEVVNITPTNKVSYEQYIKQADASAGAASAGFGTILQYELVHSAVHRPAVIGYTIFEPAADHMFADMRDGADPASRAAQADNAISAQIARLK
jgi:ABC-type glycerol-3-phosphate transport system substrate-binding protein